MKNDFRNNSHILIYPLLDCTKLDLLNIAFGLPPATSQPFRVLPTRFRVALQTFAVMARTVARSSVIDNVRRWVKTRPGNVIDSMNDNEHHCCGEQEEPQKEIIEQRII